MLGGLPVGWTSVGVLLRTRFGVPISGAPAEVGLRVIADPQASDLELLDLEAAKGRLLDCKPPYG